MDPGADPPERWDPDLRLVDDYLVEIDRGFREHAPPRGQFVAEVHLYCQDIVHETAAARVADTRRGAWVELRAAIPDGGTASEKLAGESWEEFACREHGRDVGRRLARRARESDGPRDGVSGSFAVVLEAGGCEAFLHEVGHLFEGAGAEGAVTTGWTPGTPVASSQVTIVDDPGRVTTGRGRYRCDDEGISPRKVTLIEAGRIAERIVGAPAGTPLHLENSTGHSRRASYRDLPLPRLACTILEPGTEAPDSIVSGTGEGILVRRLGSSSVDPESGRVTLSVTEAFLIEGGHVTRPIAPSFIVSDVRTMLQSIDAIGRDLTFDHGATNCVKADQHLPVMVGLPTIRIGLIRVLSP